MRTLTALISVAILWACATANPQKSPVQPCGTEVVAHGPATKECVAAAIAETAFLNYTKQSVPQYSIYLMDETANQWDFIIQGWVGEQRVPAPGFHWMVTVKKADGAADLTPGA